MRLLAGTVFDRPARCEVCEELEENCRCPPPEPVRVAPDQQTAKLAVEKRKKGKVVTVVRGLNAENNDLAALLTRLKSTCGAGGKLDQNELEVQGNHLERIRQELSSLGYRISK